MPALVDIPVMMTQKKKLCAKTLFSNAFKASQQQDVLRSTCSSENNKVARVTDHPCKLSDLLLKLCRLFVVFIKLVKMGMLVSCSGSSSKLGSIEKALQKLQARMGHIGLA